eukprot:5384280-Lingulodinium_polyedra.AAC.1
MAGPPCSTWSRARWNPLPGGGGPRPLRTRDEPWGRSDLSLSAREAEKLLLGSQLLRSTMAAADALVLAGG